MNSQQLKDSVRFLGCYTEAAAKQWLKQHPKSNYTTADLSSLLGFLRSRQHRKSDRCQTVAEAMINEKQRQQELPRKSRQLSVWA